MQRVHSELQKTGRDLGGNENSGGTLYRKSKVDARIPVPKNHGKSIFLVRNVGNMPEISRFYGIIIRIFAEAGAPHHTAHFHAYYQNHSAIFDIGTIEPIGGELPKKELRLVEAWAEMHQGELWENWERMQSGKPPYRISGLR